MTKAQSLAIASPEVGHSTNQVPDKGILNLCSGTGKGVEIVFLKRVTAPKAPEAALHVLDCALLLAVPPTGPRQS